MPTNRFQFSDDFVLNANKVGINTATPQEKLDVVGIVKGDNLKVTGVSSFTSYEGFLNSNHNITENTTLTSGTSGSLSGEIIVGTGITLSGISSTTSGQGHIDSLKVYNTLTIPVGGTLERPSKSKPGQLYYNKDFSTIEFYDGDRWRQVDNTTTEWSWCFWWWSNTQLIEYVNTATQGNSTNFGTLTVSRDTQSGSCASSIRGIFAGGSPVTNVIDYITIASEGNAIDFGDLTVARLYLSGSSSSTRGIFAGGFTPTPTNINLNTIDYITIATIGNALDFGDLISATRTASSCASPTRSIFSGGYTSVNINTIQFITISSTGNSVKFGELSATRSPFNASCSSSTRGLIFGGVTPSSVNIIDYITIASTGNAIYFGDLTGSNRFASAALSSNTRGLCGGGGNPGSSVNIIDFVTISNTGNSQDFGDLVAPRGYLTAHSDSHGGLGGF
jgi:hypothetical protein